MSILLGVGRWFARPIQRGYNRRPHFFITGDRRSLCGHSTRTQRDLPFDPETMMTTVNDPYLGEPQIRRACYTCIHVLETVMI